jgi:probable F420-dependent oxidoreductase
MPAVRMQLILTENWTMTSGRDLPTLVRWAQVAEDAGFDSVMASDHVVLGPDAGAKGRMTNPREYALPGNQDPATPWPANLMLLSAISSVTTSLRLAAAAVIAPLRHPLALAKDLATLDLLSEGRLSVLPSVSWSRDEYRALGVPFDRRGRLLDEQLEIWSLAWRGSPVSYQGRHYRFEDAYVEPGPYRPGGPRLFFGGEGMPDHLIRRLVRYGHGYNPLGRPSAGDLARLADALRAAGRDLSELELVGGTRGIFPHDESCASLPQALEGIPEQVAAGFTTFCIKPSQFIDAPDDVPAFCREVIKRVDALSGQSASRP